MHRATARGQALDACVRAEGDFLSHVTGAPVRAVSFHNPASDDALDGDAVGGLVNAYGATLRRRFVYCSDSNGYWRHQPLRQVLESDAPRLHVLTHPEWWPIDVIAPRERIARAIDGRSQSTLKRYEAQLRETGRTDQGGR